MTTGILSGLNVESKAAKRIAELRRSLTQPPNYPPPPLKQGSAENDPQNILQRLLLAANEFRSVLIEAVSTYPGLKTEIQNIGINTEDMILDVTNIIAVTTTYSDRMRGINPGNV